MDAVDDYLRIPAEYGRTLGGLRWSADGEAVEYHDGSTFALDGEIVSFLEGFAQQRSFPNFGLVLHLLGLLRNHRGWQFLESFEPLSRLHQMFRETKQVYRNAGVFCAVLCQDIPSAPDPPSSWQVWRRVILRSFSTAQEFLPRRQPGEEPPLTPADLVKYLGVRLREYDDEEIRHWLRFARGPVKEPAQRLAEAVEIERPKTLQGILSQLAREDRLAGAIPFVAQMVSALSLPPRRMGVPELPLGGYSDVSTRGQPEHILPSQFALDDLEFVRRHAERELLYYRREEPQAQTREELVLLLDQGVRTWGTVRLVLAAALLALGQLADRRRMPLWVASTSGGGVLHDPLKLSAQDLAELVQVSDLSSNPALALERTLQEDSDQPRDIVLLTHPYNLDEPDLAAAARRLRPECRLFALTVDAHGQAQLSELRGGVPLRVSRFQVDLEARPAPVPRGEPQASWTGDVEPVGFPFRFGVEVDSKEQMLFAFDHSGEWLLTATGHGMLHAWKTDGSTREVWPRGLIEGAVLREVQAVLGVAGGFVVAGSLGGQHGAFHYDLRQRSCRFGPLPSPGNSKVHCVYDHELHCVVFWVTGPVAAWDLAGESVPHRPNQLGPRGAKAVQKFINGPLPVTHLQLTGPSSHSPKKPGEVGLDVNTGHLELFLSELDRLSFTPEEDGRPVLKGWVVISAQFCGSTLVLALTPALEPEKNVRLRVYRLPDGVPLGDYLHQPDQWAHLLSDDGRLLARQISQMQVEVRPLANAVAGRWFTTRLGGFRPAPLVLLGERWLMIQIDGQVTHLVRWDQGVLVHLVQHQGNFQHLLQHQLKDTGLALVGVRVEQHRVPEWCSYDSWRFQQSCWSNLVVVVDHFGQVFLYNHIGRLIAALFAYQDQLAAWMPDGTCYGPATLLAESRDPSQPTQRLGLRSSPRAAEIIGQALLDAWLNGEGTIT